MSTLEHYFENMLFHGKDIAGNVNRNELTEEQIKTVDTCVDYIIYTLYGNRAEFLKAHRAEPFDASKLDTWIAVNFDTSIVGKDSSVYYTCPNCGRITQYPENFCPECGKQLIVEE